MNTRLVNSAAGVILAALQQNRTAAGIALALDSAQLLISPEVAAELEQLRRNVESNRVDGQRLIRAEQRRAELEAVHATHRRDDQAEIERLTNELAQRTQDLVDTDAERERLRARVVELEQLLADAPIAVTLTEKASAAADKLTRLLAPTQALRVEEDCDHPNGYGPNGCAGCGAFTPADAEDDVSSQVARLRSLLAGQRAAVEAEHYTSVHHAYPLGRVLPETGGA